MQAQADDDRPRLRPLTDQSANAKTGPAVGAHIPAFEAVDLNGKLQTFDDKECFLPKTIPLKWTFPIGRLGTQRVPEALQRKAPPQ